MARYSGGRPRKTEDERTRRNKPLYNEVPLQWDGLTRGPALPRSYDWCAQTKKWWNSFRRSPQAMVCHDSDWLFLLDTALIHDKIWRNAKQISAAELKGLANELRIRMANYGDTWENRVKQHIKIVSPETQAAKEAEIQQEAAQAVDYLSAVNAEVARLREDQPPVS